MKKLPPIFFKIILFIFLLALLGWIFYINNRHENVLEVSLQLQASRDSLAKVNQKKKPDTTVITTEKKIDKEKIQIYTFHEGLAMASYKNKFGFVNKRKQVVAHFQYDAVEDFSEGMAGVSINSLWGFIDRKGIIAIPLKYDYVSYFSEGVAGFKIGEIWGFMDKKWQGNNCAKVRNYPAFQKRESTSKHKET